MVILLGAVSCAFTGVLDASVPAGFLRNPSIMVPLPWNYLEITPFGSIITLKPIANQCVQSVKKATILLQEYLLWRVRTFTMKIVFNNG